MPTRKTHFPEYGLSLFVLVGKHTVEEAIGLFQGLGSSDASRWITYCDPSVDMPEQSVCRFPEVKRTIAAKRKEIFGDRPQAWAVVATSRVNQDFFNFWRSFAEASEQPEAAPRLFSTLDAACEWLGLPETARQAVIEAATTSDMSGISARGRSAPDPASIQHSRPPS